MDGRQHCWRIDEVLQRCNLAVLLDELATPADGALRGRRWHCPLPSHEDQHPSVSMFTDRAGHQRWRCWSGEDTHRGDAVDLVIAVRHCSRRDAIEWLADRLALQPDQPAPTRRLPPTPAPPITPSDPDPAVVRYVEMCERILWTVAGAPVRRWLAARGLEDPLLRANRVGADTGRRLLPRRRGLPPGSTIAAMFPALDHTGAVHYLQARSLNPGNGPKYLNPTAELAANPRLAWTVTTQPARPRVLVICEGIPDSLTAAQPGTGPSPSSAHTPPTPPPPPSWRGEPAATAPASSLSPATTTPATRGATDSSGFSVSRALISPSSHPRNQTPTSTTGHDATRTGLPASARSSPPGG
jgi:hypothetical protein